MIGRTPLAPHEPFDLTVVVHNPFRTAEQAAQLGIGRASRYEPFRRCNTVSLHAPELTETRGLITGPHVNSMRPGSTFINPPAYQLSARPNC